MRSNGFCAQKAAELWLRSYRGIRAEGVPKGTSMAGLPRAIHNTAKKSNSVYRAMRSLYRDRKDREVKGQTATEVPEKCESRGRPSAVAATPGSSK